MGNILLQDATKTMMGRRGDEETRRSGDGRHGDTEMGRHGDGEMGRNNNLLPLAPCALLLLHELVNR
ncbi:hypothetical protein [Trichormus sp. NMC-1]|uniref:hypothetical protein n=1 Tax=Trichormus sp. NMC-1 TaxID=1853259 RepID=UPI001F48A207|nr:hypothetical protein [Trichormus sp. NMC-1]